MSAIQPIGSMEIDDPNPDPGIRQDAVDVVMANEQEDGKVDEGVANDGEEKNEGDEEDSEGNEEEEQGSEEGEAENSEEEGEVTDSECSAEPNKFENSGFSGVKNSGKGKYKRPAQLYFIGQVQDNYVIGLKRATTWPCFIQIKDELVQGMGLERKLQVGDTVEVKRFEWNEPFRQLTSKKAEVTKDRKFWLNEKNGLLPRQALATNVVCRLDSVWEEYPGIVYYIKTNQGGKFASGEVACAGLAKSSKFCRRQIVDLDADKIKIGQIVTVCCTVLNPDALVDACYCLPPQFPYKFGTEKFAKDSGALMMIKPFNHNIPDPMFPFRSDLPLDELKTCEMIMAAATQFEMEQDADRMLNARFEGSAVRDNDEFVLTFPPKSKKEIVILAECWEIENLVKAVIELGERHFAQGHITATDAFGVNELIEFQVRVRLSNVQYRKNDLVEEKYEFFAAGGKAIVYPVPSAAIQSRINSLKFGWASGYLAEDTPRGRIMSALMGRPAPPTYKMQMNDCNDASGFINIEFSAETNNILKQINLNARQKIGIAKLLDTSGNVVDLRAPPGTGKTLLAAILASIINGTKPGKLVTVLSCSNLPLTKLVEELQARGNAQDIQQTLALFSGSARARYPSQINAIRQNTMASKLTEQLRQRMENSEQRLVQKYLADQEKPKILNERGTAKIFAKYSRPNILVCSASIAEDLLDIIKDTEYLIFDEATQASFAQIIHLVCFMPNLKGILFAGDPRQIGVHLKELPEIFQSGFGLESVSEQTDMSPGVIKTFLMTSYRFHPFLAKAISIAAYEPHRERLTPAASAINRTALTSSDFLLPNQQCPCVLIHAFSECLRAPTSNSYTDDLQTGIATTLVRALMGKGFSSQQIVVLCMYSYQQEQLESALEAEEVSVVTVDGFQAQEAEIIVLVTTKSRDHARRNEEGRAMDFFKQDRRATVALSRAKSGLFLIGDLIAISEGQVWRRFIEKALLETTVVVGQYVEDAFLNAIQRLPSGTLVGSTGPLAYQNFNNEWSAYHGNRNEAQRLAEFHFNPREWPTPREQSGGPIRGRGGNANANNNGRGRGRVGVRGRYVHYRGNVRTNRGRRGN